MTHFTATIDRKALKAALDLCKVPKANLIHPRMQSHIILGHVCLQGSPDRVTVLATDLDISIATELPANCQGNASVAVDCDTLRNALGKSKAETVTLEDVGSAVVLKADGIAMRLAKGNVDDWPRDGSVWERPDDPAVLGFDSRELAADLADVDVCVSNEQTRYYLNGVFFHHWHEGEGQPGKLRMAATDGHKLARITRPQDTAQLEKMPDVIVPKTVSRMLANILAKSNCSVRMEVGKTRVAFAWGRTRLIAKLIDGTFPDYSRVIPQRDNAARSVSLNPATWATVVEAATSHLSAKADFRAFCMAMDGDNVRAWARDASAGEAEAEMANARHEFSEAVGGEYYIGFNASYVRNLMARCQGETTFYIQDSGAPVRIESAEKPHLVNVLMPVRTDGPTREIARSPLDELNDAKARFKSAETETLVGKRELGALVTAAIDYRAAELGDRYAARLLIKCGVAGHAGDDAEQARLADIIHKRRHHYSGGMAEHIRREREILGNLDTAQPDELPEADNPQEVITADDAVHVAYIPDGPALYSSLQEFKAAAGVGSRWLIESWHDGAGWSSPRERTVATARARCLGFLDGQATAEEIAEANGKGRSKGRSWIDFPKQGEWMADGQGLVILYNDGSPRTRLTPLPAKEEADSTSDDVAALRDAVAALSAQIAAQQVPDSHADAVKALERRLRRVTRRAEQMTDLAASRKGRIGELEADLLLARSNAARYRRALGETVQERDAALVAA